MSEKKYIIEYENRDFEWNEIYEQFDVDKSKLNNLTDASIEFGKLIERYKTLPFRMLEVTTTLTSEVIKQVNVK